MAEILIVLAVLGLAAAAIVAYRAWDLRQRARARLVRSGPGRAGPAPTGDPRRLARRRRWLAPLVGAVAAVALIVLGVPTVLVVSLAAIAAILACVIEGLLVTRLEARIEAQLADAIDIMVGATRAGASAVSALDAAARASRPPLRPELDEVLGRFRLGDDPQEVLRDLARRIPLETFRLFCFTLSVNWEAGGNIAPALAATGRTIRDRIDLARRARTQAAEGLLSALGILAIVYGLGYLLWQAEPARFEAFFATTVGTRAAATAVFLQAIGLLWVARIVRVRF